jgi:hypothetical protein
MGGGHRVHGFLEHALDVPGVRPFPDHGGILLGQGTPDPLIPAWP